MTHKTIMQNIYLDIFNSKIYTKDSYLDYKLFNTNLYDWQRLINKVEKEYKLVIYNFEQESLPNDIKICKILEQEDRSDYFLEIFLKNIILRIYTNSIDIIEGDIHRSRIKNFDDFIELISFMESISVFLSKEVYFFNEMEEEEPLFVIKPDLSRPLGYV